MDEIKKILEFSVMAISALFIVFFIFGFLIWNIYLSKFGFLEYKIIQTRFILTGFGFISCGYLLFFLCYILIKFGNKLLKKQNHQRIYIFSLIYLFLSLFIFFLLSYSSYLFPKIPMHLGGGRPQILSIITTEEQIEYLSQFGIKKGAGSKIQTENLCIAYQNNDIFIVLRPDRVLYLKKEIIKGFGSIPDSSSCRKEFIKQCSELASKGY